MYLALRIDPLVVFGLPKISIELSFVFSTHGNKKNNIKLLTFSHISWDWWWSNSWHFLSYLRLILWTSPTVWILTYSQIVKKIKRLNWAFLTWRHYSSHIRVLLPLFFSSTFQLQWKKGCGFKRLCLHFSKMTLEDRNDYPMLYVSKPLPCLDI